MNTRNLDDYIKTLKSRLEFLKKRMGDREDRGEETFNSHDVKEYNAISWLVRYAEDNYVDAATHQNKWFEEELKNDKV